MNEGTVRVILAIVAAYLLGGVPFSALAARLKGVDLRAHGSGNLGATNAIRVLGPALGVPVLLLDFAKGWASAALLPGLFGAPGAELPLACGFAAVAGHVWPVWAKFRGGKGVAAAGGAFLAIAPAATGIAAALFLIVLLTTRYMSLASITAAVVLPFALAWRHASPWVLGVAVLIAALILVRHRTNLVRLVRGNENRIGKKKEATR
ncbi:MAG: glycerol-3-phosphate 1-O-acyltransferase PlsY [bacterium]